MAKFYEKAIVNTENIKLYDDVHVKDITGKVLPKKISLIPLIEDKDSIYNIESIIEKYSEIIKPQYMRIFIARSDPAMNYGMVPATLLAKYAISSMQKISGKTGMSLYPIIGAGSSPFRGNLGPDTIKKALSEYNSYYTFSIQSAFRYDYDNSSVKSAISLINSHTPATPEILDHDQEDSIKYIINLYSSRFQRIIEGISTPINDITVYLPKRRTRKLHTGLFGYSRNTGKARLPRAIAFVGALYSMGIPPEILGISALSGLPEKHHALLDEIYKNMYFDLHTSAKYFNYESLNFLKDVWKIDTEIIKMIKQDMNYIENNIGVSTDTSYNVQKHNIFSTLLLLAFKNRKFDEVTKYAYEMTLLRKFVG